MKKILLSITAICAALTINAQHVVYTASDAAAFADMTAIDADMDGYTWGVASLAAAPWDTYGDFLFSESWIAAVAPDPAIVLTPDNWIITPAINLTTGVGAELSWTEGNYAVAPYHQEKYSVYVLTSLDIPTLMATPPTPVYTTTLSTNAVMENRSVDISAIADGQATVYIAYRHYDCTDMLALIIDDITVTVGGYATVTENNLQVLSVYPNPAVDVLNISLNEEAAMVTIYSLDGKIVLNEVVNNSMITLEVSNLEAGMYIYEVSTKEGEKIRNTFTKQ